MKTIPPYRLSGVSARGSLSEGLRILFPRQKTTTSNPGASHPVSVLVEALSLIVPRKVLNASYPGEVRVAFGGVDPDPALSEVIE